jgi:hypothetical protein
MSPVFAVFPVDTRPALPANPSGIGPNVDINGSKSAANSGVRGKFSVFLKMTISGYLTASVAAS